MADLRGSITALAVLALFAGFASAQVGGLGGGTQLICSVNPGITPTLRSEGITERISDIIITCTGGTQVATGTQIEQVNITVFLASQVTSRLLANLTNVNASEALLMLDEPNSGLTGLIPGFGPEEPFTVCPTPNTGCQAWANLNVSTGVPIETAVSTPGGTTPAPNVYQGVVNGNQVTFFGVPILAPGATAARVIRITNVRTNANGIGGGSAFEFPVGAVIATSGNPSTLPISNATVNVGVVAPSLSTSSSLTTASGQCNGQTLTQANVLTFAEGFSTAFETRTEPDVPGQNATPGPTKGQGSALVQNVPGSIYDSESGFTLLVNGGTAGLANFGVRLKAVFNNIPAGARLFVSMTNVNGPAAAQLVTNETAAEESFVSSPSCTIPAPGGAGGTIPIVEITPAGGTKTEAVWEAVTPTPFALDSLQFATYATYAASPKTSYAPTSTITAASSSATIPRFIDTSTSTRILFSDLGPFGSYGTGFYPIDGSNATRSGTSQTVAGLFTVAGSGSAAVTQIDLGVTPAGSNTSISQTFAVSIWTNNSGLPGTQLANAHWNLSTGFPFGLVSITGISGVTLTGGAQYFMVVGPVSVTDNSFVGWYVNNQGVFVDGAGSSDGGVTWSGPFTAELGAFEVLGTAVAFPQSQIATTASGLLYSRVTRTYNGTVTITNISGSPLGGPFQIVLTSLTPGVTLTNAAGTVQGDPYINPSVSSLATGQSITVLVQFSNPSNALINFTPVVY